MSRFTPRRILCPVDLSPASSHILRWAGLFAEKFGGKVEALHAELFEFPRYFVPAQIETLAEETKQRRASLSEGLERLTREALGPEVLHQSILGEGHPIQVIRERVAVDSPDLIVMGSHGRSGVARLLLGSVAENIIREARCPTLVVRLPGVEASPEAARVARVLCPVNLSVSARQCLDLAAEVAETFRARLDVLHAVEDWKGDTKRAHERLCQWVPGEARARCELSEVVLRGNAAEVIVRHAREQNVDLIVIGAEHRPFLELTTLGTTTERVLRHSPCSVLVVPRQSQ